MSVEYRRYYMPISDGDEVTIAYVGRLEDGSVFDTSNRELAEQTGLAEENPDRIFEPLTIDIGDESVIPGLEDALRGLDAGEKLTVTIPPEQAYGQHRESRIGEYDREAFEEMAGDRELVEGFEVEADNGLRGHVTNIGSEHVTVDFNHELAGKTLMFEIEVLGIE